MRKRGGKGCWPPPVYVARFAAGEVVRMSSWQRLGKPFDFDRPREGICQIIGNERGRAASRPSPTTRQYLPHDLAYLFGVKAVLASSLSRWELCFAHFPPATDIVVGHIEQDGVIYPDPHFRGAKRQSPAPQEVQRSLFA